MARAVEIDNTYGKVEREILLIKYRIERAEDEQNWEHLALIKETLKQKKQYLRENHKIVMDFVNSLEEQEKNRRRKIEEFLGKYDKGQRNQETYNRPSLIDAVPEQILVDIIYRVASMGVRELFNFKLSCQTLNVVARKECVLQMVVFDDLAITPFSPMMNTLYGVDFFERCVATGNLGAIEVYDKFTDALLRQGVIKYLRDFDITGGLVNIMKASGLGNLQARYCGGILLCYYGSDKDITTGKSMLVDVKKQMGETMYTCRDTMADLMGVLDLSKRLKKNYKKFGICD